MGAFRRVRANDEDNDQLEGEGVEDMINLLSLTEESLLKNIRIRYEKQLIYTYTGSILVAVNPYRMFNIYGLDVVKQYEDSILGSQPPHLFAIGSASFQKMNKDFENQAIIISGESGAGKTESTKLLMQYLAAVNRSGTNIVTERILETNPLLESFGNAKTIRNDNSSRFGKYVELYFKGQPRGSIVGAKTSEYLLEKSRIVTQAADERNYHVFYELLSGLSEDTKRVYGLTTADRYYYLNQGGSCTINTKNDGSDFRDLQAAMEVLSFTKQEQDTIYKILAAVLHLGNIYFVHDPNEFQQEGVTISPEGSDVETRWVCLLLQLDEDWLREALTKKITEARQERLVTPLNTEQAQDARDAVAKALYQRLFTWLVERINVIVKGPEPDETTNQRDKIVSIAILDIFGFEDFRTNSFEQLCINYANESLQFYFNKHIFKQEQQEYTRERINWTMINFHDNQPTIDLIAKKPSGIIHILDDESNFPKGTDQSFLEKCHYTHQRNPLYEKPRMSTPEFGIKHYAGKVTYNVKNFLDKNRDTLRADVVQLLIQSKNSLISKMFQELRDSVVTKTISKMSGLYVTMKPKTPTVAAGFHESLLTLIDNMTKCNPWFVRCIKPNNQKMAMMFEQDVVLTQLRYTGMLETIRIRKLGFPIRHRFYTFAAKYFVLLPHAERKSAGKDDRLIAEKVLRNLADEWDGAWQIGQTKVFLREALGYYLDKRRNDIVKEAAIRIQRFSRGFTARRNYQRKRSAAITIQAGLRGWIQRSKYAVLRRGIIQAQAQYRMVLQRRKYLKMLDRPDMIRQDTLYRMREEKRVGDVLQKIENQETERNDVYLKNRANKTAQQKDMPGIHCVSQLEIPRDLANIFRQLPDHYPTHNEEHNIIRLSTVHPQMLNLVMQDDINSFAFSKYVNVYFQSHKWRMKKHVITEPFLKDSDPKEAVAIFKLIMRYMYDVNQTPRQQQLIGNYIVQKGLSNDALCDEIYAQLANQTWLNKDDEARRRGWMLMAACLSCMPPSSRIRKFLLKYVSDHGFRDYKVFCQHKLLQCINMNPDQKRTYPPCLLEWKAIKEIGCMAAQGYFTDGEDKEICHLEPWTTAEEFASYLLRQRGVRDGHHGWTMLLKDDVAIYEYAGYDYVMDLISEMELEPDFPHSWSYYITGLRRQAQTTPVRRDVKRHPHNAEEARILKLSHLGIKELLTPAPAEPRPSPDPQSYFKDKDRDQALSDSKLNRRKQDLDPSLSMDSVLNTRYTKRQAPSVPVNPPRTEQQRAQRPDSPIVLGQLPISAESKLNRRYVTQKKPMPDGLTDSKLNMRYREDLNGSASNGEPISNGELTNGDARPYVKNAHPPSGSSSHLDHTAKDQIIRQKRTTDSYRKSLSESSDFGSVRSNADMDQWVDKLFSPVLTGNLDDLVDARSLEHKMKGGGELNQPAYGASVLYPGGFNNQPTVLNLPNTSLARTQPAAVMYSTNIPMSPPTVPMAAATAAAAAVPAAIPTRLTAPVPAVVPALSPAPVPAAVPVPAPTPVPAAVPAPTPAAVTVAVPAPAPTANVPYVGPQVQISVPPAQPAVLSPPVLSVPTDPLQVVMQQGAAQDALQGQQLQTQRIQNRKLQEQTANLQAQLQQQQLQTQILQQSVQTEILKRQLKELQEKDVPKIVSVPLDKTADSSVASPRTISQTAVQPDPDQTPPPLKPAAHGEIDESRPGGVQTLKRAYEQKAPPIRGGLFVPPANSKKGATNKGRGVQFAEDVETIPQAGYSEKQPSTSSPPPPPAAARSPSPPPPPPASPPQPKQTSAHRARSPSPPPPPPPIAVSTASAPPAPPPPASSLPSPPSPPSPPTQTSQAAASASRQSAVNRDTPEALQNVLIESVNEKADGAADRGASEKDQHPPPPPPPPPTTTTTDTTPETTTTAASASDSSKSPESADSGTVKMVRIGKIQWPPPPKEVPQKEVRVGKLFIQESTPTEEPVVPIRKKLNEVVSKAKAEPEAKEVKKTEKENRRKVKSVQLPPSDKEGSIRIDMKERRETLARQLSSINFGQLKESKPKRKPLPAPIAPPPATKETEKIPPPPPKVLTVVTTEPSVGQEEQETPVDVQALEQVHTHLYQQINGPFFMYNKVNWSLEVRKELFTPHEKLDNLDPLLIRLIFAQVVQDVYVGNSVRISKEMRLKLRSLLDSYNVTPHNMLTTDLPVQRRVIEEAKEWPCYFARIFAATGGQRHPNLNYVAVSHSGVYMLKREKDLVEDTLMVLDRFRFENIMSVATPQPYTVQIQMSPYKYTIIYTHKADELRSLINAFCIECEKTEMYVRATKNYQTRESTLLSFQKGDIIKLTNRNMTLDRGWLYGSVHGRAGLFPHDYIEPVPIHEVKKIEQTRGAPKSLSGEDRTKDESIGSVTSTSSLLLEEGTYTMLEFAMMYFRKSPYRYQMARGEGGSIHGTFKEISLQKLHSLEKRKKKHSANGKNWTWKEQVDMIRWTKSPIQISLLELNKEHNKIALECFIAIMRYMGDYPMAKGMGHINCILFVLMQCHSRRVLVDEVFCQLIKQTTNNRSTKSDSETMGWRFLAILTSYFDVSDNLRPYLFKYLESVAHDSSRSTQVLATLCLENARKTVKYGGRKNVPSKNELEAITHGRMTRRQICVLPGGAPVVLNLKSSNVVADLIEKIAANLDIRMPLEREEYILFYVIEEDDIYCPLSTKEYIFDIITELENNKKTFYLLFQRTSWIFPLHLDNHNSLYIDAIYNLCLPDYLDGFLISVPNTTLPQPLKDDIAYIGALLLRIAGKKETPNQKDTSSVIPLNVQSLGDMKLSNWSNQIYHRLFELIDLTPEEAKIRFLEKISEWPLFGSTFFSVKGVSDPRVPGECRLAVNKKGIICLNPKTNETLVSYPLPQIISTRQSTSEKGRHIDIKIGDLMNHKIVQIYAEQVSDIGILINQYITLSKEI